MSFLGLVQEKELQQVLRTAYFEAFREGVVELNPERQYILILSGIAQEEIDKVQETLKNVLDLDGRNLRIVIISTPHASLLEL